MEHKDIKSDLYSEQEYQTLKYPNQDYELTDKQQEIIDLAWEKKDNTPN